GEIVDAHHRLTEGEQLLEESGSNKAGNAGDHPYFRGGRKVLSKPTIRCGDHELAVEELPAGPISEQSCAGARPPDHARRNSGQTFGDARSIFHSLSATP